MFIFGDIVLTFEKGFVQCDFAPLCFEAHRPQL